MDRFFDLDYEKIRRKSESVRVWVWACWFLLIGGVKLCVEWMVVRYDCLNLDYVHDDNTGFYTPNSVFDKLNLICKWLNFKKRNLKFKIWRHYCVIYFNSLSKKYYNIYDQYRFQQKVVWLQLLLSYLWSRKQNQILIIRLVLIIYIW